MRTYKLLTLSLLLAGTTFAAACSGDKDETDTASPTTTAATATDGSTGDATTSGSTSPTTPTTTEATTDGVDPFIFDETPADELTQVDRMGMPAVATAVISSGMKDAYNEANPEVDATQAFVADIVANVTGLHAALDDDLMGFGLTPCEVNACAAQGGPLVVPDTLKIDVTMPSAFPNGRRLDSPVIDVTLAVIMLDLKVHAADTFANIPLNPSANDKEFLADFPYLAVPH